MVFSSSNGSQEMFSVTFGFVKALVLFAVIVFALPAGLALGWWSLLERPSGWRTANWESAGILPPASAEKSPAVYVLAARTGGLKGALSQHSWIVTKNAEASSYDRYDKLGWGQPVRRNAYPADGKWYSNTPQIVFEVHGQQAANLIPRIEAAIEAYPHSDRGGYKLWPGPNSNSFIAYIVNNVPELGISLPPNAVGRDYLAGGNWYWIDPDWSNLIVNWDGIAGFAVGSRNGFEIHFMGLVAGADFNSPAIKVPGFGKIDLAGADHAVARTITSE